MSRVGHLSRTIAALVLVAAMPVAQAQMLERGWYFELAMGKAKFKDVTTASIDAVTRGFFDFYELPVQTLTSTLDNTDRSYAIVSGYQINPYFSFEAGFFRLGAAQYGATGTVSDDGTLLPATFNFSYRGKGVMIGGTAALPLGEYFEVRGRAGITNSETRVRVYASVEGDALRDSYSESSQDFYYGAGVGLRLGDYYRVGADFMRHNGFGKANGNGSTDVDNVLLSISYLY